MKAPTVRYAHSPLGKIAYQILGDGPLDLVFVPLASQNNLDVIWEHPPIERYLRRLASFSRVILFNLRGSGLSDPISLRAPVLEESMMDMKWVLDAVDSQRAALLASEYGGLWSAFFAATFPDRTQALVLLNSFATLRRHIDYPAGFPPDALDSFTRAALSTAGTGESLLLLAPELAGNERFREWFARLERLSSSPGVNEILFRFGIENDARGILSHVRAPTLVISHAEHAWLRPGHGRYLAEHIQNARHVERPGAWGLYWAHDVQGTLDEVESFLTGTKGTSHLDDRVLATVLFTDIVASTQRASELGDRRWRELLDEHDVLARREIDRFRGRIVNSLGDGIMATFDGPARAILCATAVADAVRPLGVEIRTGVHTGEVELRGDDVGGIAVHIAARVMAEGSPGEVLVSGAVPPLVAGSGIVFLDRGSHELKGVPGEWQLFAVKT